MMKSIKYIFVALIFGIFLGVPVGSAEESSKPGGFGVSLGPSIIRMSGNPGDSQSSPVRVWNKSPNRMKFMVNIMDIGNRVDEDGKLARDYMPPGTMDYSCAKWILLKEEEFSLEPGGYKDYEVLMSAPSDAQGVYGATVFFRGVPDVKSSGDEDTDKAMTSVQIQPRLGVLVFYEVAGTVIRKGAIENFTVDVSEDADSVTLNYIFENMGNADILVTGNFYILDQSNALVAKADLNPFRTFPGDRGFEKTYWEGFMEPGTYRLIATYELGPDTEEVIVKEHEFSVS